jgi:hypothetical protein
MRRTPSDSLPAAGVSQWWLVARRWFAPFGAASGMLPVGGPNVDVNVAYQLTLDDFVAFNMSHQRRSPLLRAITLGIFIIAWVAIPVGVLAYLLPRHADTNFETTLFLVVWAVVHFLVFGYLVLRIIRRGWSSPLSAVLIRRMLTEGDTSSMVGQYKLIVSPTEMTESSPKGESTCAMSAVQRIVVTDEHVFIYVAPVQAFVVPRNAFRSATDFEDFVAMIEEYSGQSAIIEGR